MQGQMQQFASQPQAVSSRKYRSPDEATMPLNNLMYDKRVVRGSTYAAVTAAPQLDAAEVRKQREAQRRRLTRANQTKKRAGTPEPVAGRKHMDIQTDSYLEELTERTVEFEAETQTDFLLDRPPSPLFMPSKIGLDMETQIEEGELFDFDVECEPILEVLVGKTLELSMMEVLEEEELESLRRYQQEYEKRRNAELLEVQRMEGAEKRRQDEMERRLQQQASQREKDLSVMRKVVARSVAAAQLSSLRERCLAHLLDGGRFQDSVQLAVDTMFMPTLLQSVLTRMDQSVSDRSVVGDVLSSIVSKRLKNHDKCLDLERMRLAAIDQADREAREEKEQQRKQREADQERLRREQAEMSEWEAFVPPAEPEQHVTGLDMEAAEGATMHLAKYGDGLVAFVPREKLEDLQKMLEVVQAFENMHEQEAEGVPLSDKPAILGKLAPAVDGADHRTFESFRLGTAADLQPPSEDLPGEEN